ncbi:MAG TPA: hydroxymethylbilane synthase [Gemmatimonadales bacterium]|nr:hydroxymethylbilane synthase [Gemmatimonadales bacterium]
MKRTLKIGTRGSDLALWQSRWVQARLADAGTTTEIVIIKTQGDAEVDRPLHEMTGTGFFTKAIEDALLDRRVDLAVHSLKDLPTSLPPGLALGAVPKRVDSNDVLVVREHGPMSLLELAPGVRIGTSSLRRIAQVRYLRPDLEVVPLRGNVPTRVRKVKEGSSLDAAVLAFAGLERLGLSDVVRIKLDPLELMPAPGQGALGLEIRSDDDRARTALRSLDDPESAAHVQAERALLAALEGGCQAPVAAYVGRGGKGEAGGMRLYGRVTAPDGSLQLTASAELSQDPAAVGHAVAGLLRDEGALELLAR